MIRSLDEQAPQEYIDRPAIEMNQEEFDLISTYSFPKDEEEKAKIEAILKEKGIAVDTGNILINVDGVTQTMTTVPHDFGTIVNTGNIPDVQSGF